MANHFPSISFLFYVQLLQFLGGSTGQQLSEILAPHHIPTHTVKIAQPTRMATTLLSRLATAAYPETELIDPSPHVSHEEAMALIMALREATGTSLTRHSHSRLGLALMGTSPQCEDRLDLYVTALQAVARVVESAAAALAASSALLPVDGQFYRSGDGAAKGDAETAEPALTDSATPANQQEHQQADLLPLPLILLDASKDVDHVLATGRISVLKINYHELQTIAKLPPDDCPPRLSAWAAKQSRTALQQLLLHLHVPALAVTDGGHPAFLCHFVNDDAPPAAASADAVRETSELIVAWTITLPPVQVFNAVGCGDITSAAMLAALLADPAKLPWETRDTSSGTLSGEMVLRAFQFGLSVATAACQVKPDAWRLDRALEIMRQLQVTSLFST